MTSHADAPGGRGLSGSRFDLSARAALTDPAEPGGCTYPLLHRRW